MIMILLKSLGKRTSIGSYYDEKSLTKCYWDGVFWLFSTKKARKLRPHWSNIVYYARFPGPNPCGINSRKV